MRNAKQILAIIAALAATTFLKKAEAGPVIRKTIARGHLAGGQARSGLCYRERFPGPTSQL